MNNLNSFYKKSKIESFNNLKELIIMIDKGYYELDRIAFMLYNINIDEIEKILNKEDTIKLLKKIDTVLFNSGEIYKEKGNLYFNIHNSDDNEPDDYKEYTIRQAV